MTIQSRRPILSELELLRIALLLKETYGFMAARVVHFGINNCHRIAILKGAGYSVDVCPSIGILQTNLIQFPDPDAVAIAENEGTDCEASSAISLVRSNSAAPLVLFQGQERHFETSSFDLVVSPLTDPRLWLSELEDLIEESRAIRFHCSETRTKSALLLEQARALVEKSRSERQRSRLLLKRVLPDTEEK